MEIGKIIKNIFSGQIFSFSSSSELIAKDKLNPSTESLMLAMLNVCPKLVLTGSTVLCSTKILDRKPGDLDFGIKEPLTETDLKILMDMFDLKERMDVDKYGDVKPYDEEGNNPRLPLHQRDIICLIYHLPNEDDYSKFSELRYVKIDIFTKERLNDYDLVKMKYFDHKLIVAHPSIPLSYKMRYALNPQVNARQKHLDDISNISKQYELIVKGLISISRLNNKDR